MLSPVILRLACDPVLATDLTRALGDEIVRLRAELASAQDTIGKIAKSADGMATEYAALQAERDALAAALAECRALMAAPGTTQPIRDALDAITNTPRCAILLEYEAWREAVIRAARDVSATEDIVGGGLDAALVALDLALAALDDMPHDPAAENAAWADDEDDEEVP